MQGQLFTQDFLHRGIRDTPPWLALSDAALGAFSAAMQALFAPYRSDSTLNEAQTEQELIVRVLTELGWGNDTLAQVNLSGKRREDVPDMLLFPDAAAKAAAIAEPKDDRRYRHGLAILEAKRWLRTLDRGDPAEVAQHLRRGCVGVLRLSRIAPVQRAQPALGLQDGQAVAVAAVEIGRASCRERV